MSRRGRVHDFIWTVRVTIVLWLLLTAGGYCLAARISPLNAVIAQVQIWEALGWAGQPWPTKIWIAPGHWVWLGALGPHGAAAASRDLVSMWFWCLPPAGAALLLVLPAWALRRWRKTLRAADLQGEQIALRGGDQTDAASLAAKLRRDQQ